MMSSTQKGTKPHESPREYNLKCHNQVPQLGTIFYTSEWPQSKKKQKTLTMLNVSKNMKQVDPSYIAGKPVQPLWRTQQFPMNSNIPLPYDLIIILLDIYQRELHKQSQQCLLQRSQMRKELKAHTQKVKVKLVSRGQPFVTPWTIAYQAPHFMGFSRQEYWNGLPFPSPGELPNPGIEPGSPALQADALTSEPPHRRMGLTSGGAGLLGRFSG